MSTGDVVVTAVITSGGSGKAADDSCCIENSDDNNYDNQLHSGSNPSSSFSTLIHDSSSSSRPTADNNVDDDDDGGDYDIEEDGDEVVEDRRPLLFKTVGGFGQQQQPSEEETVLTSASSQTSLTPENPLFAASSSSPYSGGGKGLYEGVLSSYRTSLTDGMTTTASSAMLQSHATATTNLVSALATTNASTVQQQRTTTPNADISRLATSALFVDQSSRPVFRTTTSRSESLPPDFNKSPEPIPSSSKNKLTKQNSSHLEYSVPLKGISQPQQQVQQQSKILSRQSILESTTTTASHAATAATSSTHNGCFRPQYTISKWLEQVSQKLLRRSYSPDSAATWIGFWALMLVTCANYVLTPMRDAIALAVGVQHIPNLTLASTILAVFSSVPIGWLFEAPDPKRRKLWKRMGLTRGETQGTSLALFYRFFALTLLSYSLGFKAVELVAATKPDISAWPAFLQLANSLLHSLGHVMYIAFFLVVHLMKLHALSLIWGVTTEAMDYEDVARNRHYPDEGHSSTKSRLQRLGLVGFGGTVGGILGSVIASSMAHVLRLSGLLVVSCVLLEVSAQLSIELGRIMQKHWEEQQLFKSTDDLASLDPSMKRSTSLGSMKRVASGNSLHQSASTKSLLQQSASAKSLSDMSQHNSSSSTSATKALNRQVAAKVVTVDDAEMKDNTFYQRLLRGITTILRSRLLMAIFTYNALYASTTVLLSFQRAVLVANRNAITNTEADTVFLANINMASSVAIFILQASGAGAYVAHACGSRGTLTLMPLVRLVGVLALGWWHRNSNGRPPNLLLFLVLDECTKVMNLAVAKPVRESLWRGLSNEARYEAKPIVDTLANRWGGGSAAFLVAFINKTLDVLGVQAGSDGNRMLFGFPPILFLCMVVAAWWTMVSADLGQIRRRIDIELKKHQ